MNEERCSWPTGHQILIDYHDHEWGEPVHDDRKHFEFMVLDLFHAGLSWLTIIKKRENFRAVFDKYIWQFIGGSTIHNEWKELKQIPVTTTESDEMSKQLKKLGFKFVGSTICYSYMQAAGMVNDYLLSCFRYKQLLK